MLGSVSITSYGAVVNGDYTIAILNLTGLVMVVVEAGGKNKYCTTPHSYHADNIRIALMTTASGRHGALMFTE